MIDLRALRKRQHLTQAQVADLLGVRTAFVSAVERRKKHFSNERMLEAAKVYQVPVQTLVTDRAQWDINRTMVLLGAKV